jgi:hypothetical protein
MARNPNRMQEATDRLMGKFQQTAGVVVTYTKGSLVLSNVTATVGRTPFDVSDGQVMTAYESRDYLIKKSDLMYLGLHITPENGDRITEASGRVYEVGMPDKSMNVFESIGPDGTVFKIHTKAVA